MRVARPAPATGHRANLPRTGFTLVEVLVVLVVVMLLSVAALPAFQGQLARGRRADGQQALQALALRLERYYSERGSYVGAALGAGGVYPAVSSGGYYALRIVNPSAEGYSLTATPQGAQAADPCATLGYNHLSAVSVSATATLTAAHCW